MKKLTSKQIFQQFELAAKKWGKQHQIVHVGDIVEFNTGKRTVKMRISNVEVVVGWHSQKSGLLTFAMMYAGRKIKKDGSYASDDVGGGRVLYEFKTLTGYNFNFFDEFGITNTYNHLGLSFYLEQEPECIEKYGKHSSYAESEYPYKH